MLFRSRLKREWTARGVQLDQLRAIADDRRYRLEAIGRLARRQLGELDQPYAPVYWSAARERALEIQALATSETVSPASSPSMAPGGGV